MKYYLLTCFFLCVYSSNAQTVVFHENMENIDSLTSAGTPGWSSNSRLQMSGMQSDSSAVAVSSNSVLETTPFNLTGNTYVILSFKHICKTSFFDKAIVEVFNGTSWIQLTAQNMVPGQTDSSAFDGQLNNFSEAIYIDWLPGSNTLPDNSWWKTEVFDVSPMLANITNAKVRWVLEDQGLAGGEGKAGWFIDDISVIAAPCELQPPAIAQVAPFIQNSVLNLGPFVLNAIITDASGLDTSSLNVIYTVNGGAQQFAPLSYVLGNKFSAIIPAVADSDTICYYFSVFDNSPCHNVSLLPSGGCIQFVAYSGLIIPFCDNFDLNNYWIDSTLSGSAWQYGTPSVSPPSAHSAPHCWEVALGAPYATNTTTYLQSPDLSFLNIYNASVNFWYYSDCFAQYDGVRLEFSLNGGVTWSTLGNTGTGTNWYNYATLFTTNLPGWSGTSGWVNAIHNLSAFDNLPLVSLRFVFNSTNFGVNGNGFAIDDFCITVPQPFDAGVQSIINPTANAPVGNCEPVVVAVHNFGSQPISNFNVVYSINGTTTGTFLHAGTLSPGTTVNDTILPCYTVSSGQSQICAWTSLINDSFHYNDTSCSSVVGVQTFVINDSVSYCDLFDGVNAGWSSQILTGGNTGSIWALGTPSYGATNSAYTSPNSWDINLTTAYSNNANVALVSPYFDINSPFTHLRFYRNHNTELAWDGTRLEYTTNGGLTWTMLGVLNDPLGINWYNQNIFSSNLPAWAGNSPGWSVSEYTDLSALNGQVVQFRFVFTSDASVTMDGFSIDNFCLFVPQVNGAAAVSVASANSNPLIAPGQCVSFTAIAKNTGVAGMSSLIEKIFVDGILLDADTVLFNPVIPPNTNATPHVFSNCWIAAAGIHTICFVTGFPNNANDIVTGDDTVCISINVQPLISVNNSNPYCNDFELGQPWTTYNAITYTNVTSWVQGNPLKTNLNGCYTGTNSWVTNLNASYNASEHSGLFTPYFSLLTNTTYKLSFYSRFKTELNADGGTVEFSTNNGTTWTVLGNASDPQWMNTVYISSLSTIPQITPGWSGNSGATWNYYQHLICFQDSSGTNTVTLLLRFHFGSDFSVNDEGWQLDNVCLEQDPALCFVSLAYAEDNHIPALGQNNPNPFSDVSQIEYYIPEKSNIELNVTDITGRKIIRFADANRNAGNHKFSIDGKKLKPGIYFYSLKYKETLLTRKMIIE